MLTNVKAKAWKKVIVMGISLSLSGFVPVMTTSYAFADENPEMVDITSENVYQIEEEDSQNMVNEPSEGLEKINLQAEQNKNEGKNQEILVNDPHDKDMNEEVNNDVTSDEPEANNENVTEETFKDQESKDQEEGSDAQEENASYIIEEETETAEDTSDETSEDPVQEEQNVDDESMIAQEDSQEEEIVEGTEADTEEKAPETATEEITEESGEDMTEDAAEETEEEVMLAAEEGEFDEAEPAEDEEASAEEESIDEAMVAAEEEETVVTDETAETDEAAEAEEDVNVEMTDTTESLEEDPVVTDEASIEEMFPETYQTLIQQVQAAHPEWKIKASDTGIDWETALDAEDEGSRNLISPSAPDSQKEKSNKKYDGRWSLANRDTIAYYMDPRNFINEEGIYQFLDQSYDPESQNVDSVADVIEGSFMEDADPEGGYDSYEACIDDVGAETDVNANVLAAMIIEEQGWEGSSLSSGKKDGYEGYYNHMNVGAWTTDDMSSVERGLWYAKGEGKNKKSYNRPWDSPAKAIKGGAEVYSENYVSKNQDTYYTKKFNVMNGEESVGTHQYMTNVQAASDEGKLVSKAYKENPDLPAIFKIPVFENMPDEICTLPGK